MNGIEVRKMKKLILTLLFTMVAAISYAQSNSENNTSGSNIDKREWINKEYKNKFKYPITAGISVFYDAAYAKSNINTYDKFHHGGGAALTSKLSFSKYLAFGLDLSLAGTTKTLNNNTKSNFTSFAIAPSLIFQRETERNQAGLVPWGGVGVLITANNYDVTNTTNGGFGFTFNVGLRYNFKENFYTGGRVDYLVSPIVDSVHKGALQTIRVGLEAGYRF